MITCPAPEFPEEALLRLRLRGLTAIDGRIVWQHRGHAGVRFLTPLHQALIEHLGCHAPAEAMLAAEPPAQAGAPVRRQGLHGDLVKRAAPDDIQDRLAG